MKKWVLAVLCQLFYLSTAFGIYSGNPADPFLGNGSLWLGENYLVPKLGFQRDYITDRKIKSRSLPSTNRVDEFEFVSDQATLAIDFCQRVEATIAVGSGRLFSRFRPHDIANRQEHEDIQFKDSCPVWNIGGKVIVCNWCNTILSVSGAFQQFRARAAWDGLHTTDFRVTKTKIHFNEWQISLGAAYNFYCLVPYANLNFSGLLNSHIRDLQLIPVDTDTSTVDRLRLRTRKLVGLSLGTSFTPVDCFYVTVELRTINERSLTLQGQIKF